MDLKATTCNVILNARVVPDDVKPKLYGKNQECELPTSKLKILDYEYALKHIHPHPIDIIEATRVSKTPTLRFKGQQ